MAMTTYSIGDLNRREILKMSAMVGVAGAISTKYAIAQAALQRTPHQILGPFYPMKLFDQTADLTRVPGRPGRAEGQVLNVMGRVLNLKGEPVRNAKVEVWQANAHGRYTHPSDSNPAPLVWSRFRASSRHRRARCLRRSSGRRPKPGMPRRGRCRRAGRDA